MQSHLFSFREDPFTPHPSLMAGAGGLLFGRPWFRVVSLPAASAKPTLVRCSHPLADATAAQQPKWEAVEQCPTPAVEASAGSGHHQPRCLHYPSSTPWGGARESQAPFPRKRLKPGDGAGCRPPVGSHRFLRKRSVTFGPALPPHQDSRCLRGGHPAPTAQPGFGTAPAHRRSSPAPQPPRSAMRRPGYRLAPASALGPRLAAGSGSGSGLPLDAFYFQLAIIVFRITLESPAPLACGIVAKEIERRE